MFQKCISLFTALALVFLAGCHHEEKNLRPEIFLEMERTTVETEASAKSAMSEENVVVDSDDELDMSDWSTYRNEEYGYTIQRPKDSYLYSPYASQTFIKNKADSSGAEGISITVLKKAEGNTLENEIEKLKGGDGTTSVVTEREAKLQNLYAIQLLLATADQTDIYYLAETSDHVYILHSLDDEDLYEEIIATFALIESDEETIPTETICDAPELTEEEKNAVVDGWKRYRNTKYCFEIKYPSEWMLVDEGGRLIHFANYESYDGFQEEVRQNPDIERYKSMFIWIFLKDQQTFYDIKSEYTRRAENTIDFETGKGDLILYADSVRSVEQDNSWDVVVPDFKVLLESDDYNFMLNHGLSTINRQEQEEKMEFFKKIIKTFKFLD